MTSVNVNPNSPTPLRAVMRDGERSKPLDPGYVYILESTDGSKVKIGMSANPEVRLKALRTGADADGRSWVSSRQARVRDSEGICHSLFSPNRSLGEWFNVSFDTAVAAVESTLTSSMSDEDYSIWVTERSQGADENIAAIARALGYPTPRRDYSCTATRLTPQVCKEVSDEYLVAKAGSLIEQMRQQARELERTRSDLHCVNYEIRKRHGVEAAKGTISPFEELIQEFLAVARQLEIPEYTAQRLAVEHVRDLYGVGESAVGLSQTSH